MSVSARRFGGISITPVRSVLALAVVVLVVTPNLWLAARSIGLVFGGAPAVDWQQYIVASQRFWAGGELYAITGDYAYRYSPLFAALLTVLVPLGVVGWRLLHVAAALALPNWPIRVVALVSWPFWYDVQTGNVLIFIVLAGAWALRGNRWGTGGFLLLTLLVPRPLMIPVAAWLLWKQPGWRWPLVFGAVAQLLIVAVLGWGNGWLATLLNASRDSLLPSNVGPSRFVGQWWVAIGIPLAIWLTVRGRVGWASLAASPYWLPYYLLMPILGLAGRASGASQLSSASRLGCFRSSKRSSSERSPLQQTSNRPNAIAEVHGAYGDRCE
jgi:hypothetical protein